MSEMSWSMSRDLCRKHEIKVLVSVIINLRRTARIRRRPFFQRQLKNSTKLQHLVEIVFTYRNFRFTKWANTPSGKNVVLFENKSLPNKLVSQENVLFFS